MFHNVFLIMIFLYRKDLQKDKKDESYSPVRMNVLDKGDANLTGTVNVGDVIKLRFYLDDETGENGQCIETACFSVTPIIEKC